jgi:hypothetical protein
MSEQAILGSFKLWIEFQRTNEHNYHNHEEIRTEIVLANGEQIETIENKEENEDEDSDKEDSNEQELVTLTSEDQEIADAITTDESDTANETLRNEQIVTTNI